MSKLRGRPRGNCTGVWRLIDDILDQLVFKSQVTASGQERKRSCTDLAHAGVTTREGMSISGHRTESEWQRYTEKAERDRLAAAGMAKRQVAEQKKALWRG